MKQLLIAVFLCLGVSAIAQTKTDVQFTQMKHSFGKIKQNVPVTHVFSFKNASTTKSLIIETATAECGCTNPEYSVAPVGKGKSGTIKVTFNAATPGAFTKKVTVKFAKIPEPVILTIEGDVTAATK